MNEKKVTKRRERGTPLEPEQIQFIEQRVKREGLTLAAAAKKIGITERTLSNALVGKKLDKTTQDCLVDWGMPDINHIRREERNQFDFQCQRERNHYFTARVDGRGKTMEELRVALQQRPFEAVTQGIAALGGMGKTATAIEFAYRCLDTANFPDYPRYKAIQFARADTVEVLTLEYARIAKALCLLADNYQNTNVAVQAVIDWMANPEEGPWLLILDNADNPGVLQRFLPIAPQRHYGHVIVTSRSHHLGNRIKRLELAAMDEEEGIEFLYRRTQRVRETSPKVEQMAARTLVTKMGGVPLALEQAAAYMTVTQTMSFADYLAAFQQDSARSELMMQNPEYGFYHRFHPDLQGYAEALTVLTTWQMSLAKIQSSCPEAVQLLQFCAFLHPVGIPKELVRTLLPHYFALAGSDSVAQNALYNSLLNVLLSYSLVEYDVNNATHSVNVMVQTVLYDGLGKENRKRILEWVLTALARSFPSRDYVLGGRGVLFYPHAESLCKYVDHAIMEGESVGRLVYHMGTFLCLQGRYNEAQPLLERALEKQAKVLHADHPDIVDTLNSLGPSLFRQKNFDAAKPYMRQALLMSWSALRDGHADNVRIRSNLVEGLNNLGVWYYSQGRFKKAAPLFLKALKLKRRWFVEDDHVIVNGLSNLGAVYQIQGKEKYGKAEALYLEALSMREKALYKDQPYHVAVSHNNLGVLYREWGGRDNDAEFHFLQAMKIWRESFPKGHPDFVKCLDNLAELYRRQERDSEAERLRQEADLLR